MSIKTRNGVPVEVEDKPWKAVAVLRVSTRRQAAKGNSYENQKEGILDYIQEEGGELIKTFTLQQSGSTMTLNQGALFEVIKFAVEEGATVVINSLDRLSRDCESLWQIKNLAEKEKVNVIVAQTRMNLRDLDTMTYSMLSGIAQHEKEQTAQRIKRSKFKSQGYFNEDNASDAGKKSAEIRKANFEQWAETIDLGGKLKDAVESLNRPTLIRISTWLNGIGSTTQSGKKWKHGTLLNVIKRMGFLTLDDFIWRFVLGNKDVWTKERGRLK